MKSDRHAHRARAGERRRPCRYRSSTSRLSDGSSLVGGIRRLRPPHAEFRTAARGSGAGLGHYGVAFFFVLSGFVLTWSAKPTTTMPTFWWRRFARIYPASFVALLLAIPVFYSFDPDPHSGG